MLLLCKRDANKTSGFTLVELLIVVAIIAILVAIARPHFSAYIKRVHTATINSDARNSYKAAIAYFLDNPTATTVDCAYLTGSSSGFRLSPGVTCASSDITLTSGDIEVAGLTTWGLTTNEAEIDYRGVLTEPAVP